MFRAFLAHHQEILFCLVSRSLWQTVIQSIMYRYLTHIPSLPRQRFLPSWGPRRTPCFLCNFSTVDYSNYGFWISENIIFKFTTFRTWK
jgi:hypothetical protein